MKILFICTHNRCRSILSEAITNHLGKDKFQAFSAGSQPAGLVHPLTLKYLAEKGIPSDGLRSQSWDEFEVVQPDIVMTVCDSAAAEDCPLWFGNTLKIHWPLPDPSKSQGNDAEIREAFYSVMETIERRVRELLALNLHLLPKNEQRSALERLIHN